MEVAPRLGEDISAGRGYGLETGQKTNDVAVPNAEEPIYYIDFKIQQSNPRPKTTLNPLNALAKIQLMRTLKATLGRLVPVLILNPMGLRPAIRRDDQSVKGLWLRYRILFLEDDGTSESVSWKEAILEGVMSLQQLTDEILDDLKEVLDAAVADIDQATLQRRIDEIEGHLFRKAGKALAGGSPESKSGAVMAMVTEDAPQVQKEVLQNVITEVAPEVRQSVLATWSDADLEAELARRKVAAGSGNGKSKK